MDYYEIFSVVSLPLGILILLVLLCRSLVLWYFKIPDMISKQDELIREMKIQNDLLKTYFKIPGEPALPSPQNGTTSENQEKKPSFTELRYGKS